MNFDCHQCTVCQLALLLLFVAGASTAQAAYQDQVLADSPVAYWRFEDASSSDGSTALNSGTTAATNDGTYQGSTALSSDTPGVIGGTSGDFTGSNARVELGTTLRSALSGSSAITAELWFNASSLPADGSVALLFNSFLNETGTGLSVALQNSAGSGSADTVLRVAGRSTGSDSFTTGPISYTSTDTWTHFVGVLDFANDQIKLYVNGSSAGTIGVSFGSSTYAPSGATSLIDSIGKQNNASGFTNAYNGLIDELAVYGGELSSTRVAAHYAAATTVVPEPASIVALSFGAMVLMRRRRG